MIEIHAHMKPLKVAGSVALRVVMVERRYDRDYRTPLVDQCMPETVAKHLCKVLTEGSKLVPGFAAIVTSGRPS